MTNHERNWILSWQNVEHLMEQGDFKHALPVGNATTLIFSQNQLSVKLLVDPDEDLSLLPILPHALRFEANLSTGTLTVNCVDTRLNQFFYAFVCEALERVKFHNSSVVSALLYSWSKLRELIEQEVVLSREKQIGLIGELLFLKLIASVPGSTWKTALDSWHNDAISEHDFGFANADVEVKTTSQERRIHMIGSLNQLRESPSRSLHLASYHLTSAPTHAKGSVSLATLSSEIKDRLSSDPALSERFIARLELAGWNQQHNDFYTKSFVDRSVPAISPVGPNFPRIVPDTLSNLDPDQISRIQSVVYSIDVSGLGTDLEPEMIMSFLK